MLGKTAELTVSQQTVTVTLYKQNKSQEAPAGCLECWIQAQYWKVKWKENKWQEKFKAKPIQRFWGITAADAMCRTWTTDV